MAYHGYIPGMKGYLSEIEKPNVLEIGLDRGVTTIPLIAFMTRFHKSFDYTGVDVLLQESLIITLNNLDLRSGQNVSLMQKNSLEALPDFVKKSNKFDLVLIDGDHNYYTVADELSHLNSITHDRSLVIIDDYEGRWSEKDLWYSDREEYKKVDIATKAVATEKHGVKPAVDEFLESNPQWIKTAPIPGEPVVLTKRKL